MGILPRTLNVLFNSFQGRIYKRTNLKPKMFCDVVKLASAQECKEDSKKNVMLTMLDNAVRICEKFISSRSVGTHFIVF